MLYKRWRHLAGIDNVYTWRSGIKHDCAKVMELELSGERFRNGNGIEVALETSYLYPMFKSSDVGNNRLQTCRKYMLVTQRKIGGETADIEQDAPQTWHYLQLHAQTLAKCSSSIYKNRPPFSIFGVGEYTFSPWKVAISGFYKSLSFRVIGPMGDRPVVFDDTVYFLPCWSEQEARFVAELLNSEPAQEFFASMVFWNNKRPITVDLLKRLNIHALARQLGREQEYHAHISDRLLHQPEDAIQMSLLTT